jgi:hypothetical protein
MSNARLSLEQQWSTRYCEPLPNAEAAPFDDDVGAIELIEADDVDRVTDQGTYTPFPGRIERLRPAVTKERKTRDRDDPLRCTAMAH